MILPLLNSKNLTKKSPIHIFHKLKAVYRYPFFKYNHEEKLPLYNQTNNLLDCKKKFF